VIVLDTTILVYAKGADHPLRAPCRALVGAIERGEVAATTTAEAIQEFAHVRSRRRDRTDAAALARDFVDLLAPLIPITEQHVRSGLALFERLPELGSFDAVLAAAAIDVGADALVSADRAFASVPELVHVDPGTRAMSDLLGS
jgi:uncharacterized protein